MGLPRVRLLQIGDLHLPSAARTERNVDQKDRTFSVELRNVISRQPIKTVFKRIYRMCEAGEVDGVLLMGDMTDFGKLDGYQAGLAYVTNALQLGAGRRNASTFCGIVPGNHDIDRNLAKQPSMTAKFSPLNAALSAAGLGQIPVEKSIIGHVGSTDAGCALVLMNSCWGCGAVEYIPAEFRDSIGTAIESAIAKGDPKVLSAYYDRQFDTPAFSDASISELVEFASSRPREQQLVVVAHHNLLPQRLTRLAPYTELVNSGAVRSSLMEAKRPILYLHGHIHTDPVEVLSVPGGDVLVCISAPAAESGFNVIEVVFTRSGNPLVGHVIPWTFDQSAVLREGERLTVPLIGKRRRSLDGGLAKAYAARGIGEYPPIGRFTPSDPTATRGVQWSHAARSGGTPRRGTILPFAASLLNGGFRVERTFAYAAEIAGMRPSMCFFLRTQLGGAAVAQPAIDISGGSTSAFSAAVRAAGLITPNQSFDPYANDENFRLGAFISRMSA